MSQSSHVLGLPYIQPAQAQKHVTHNEAIRVLDALVQLSVTDRDQTSPPASPVSGDRHIVAAGATGAWAGEDGAIAVYEDAAWVFYPPQEGWQAVVRSEGVPVIWGGSAWGAAPIDAAALQNLDSLGVNTTADATNRLSVSSDATLLSHDGDDHRVVVNKAAATDTASLLFQTGFSGRAEMGTAGSDDFSFKVSPDAVMWNTGLTFDAATGAAAFPSGAKTSTRIEVGGRWYCYGDNRWVTHNASYGAQSENNNASAGTAAEPSVSWTQMGMLVDQGAQLETLTSAMRGNNAQLTGFDMRVVFQTGPWNAGFSTSGAVTRTVLHTADNLILEPGFNRYEMDLGQYVAPADGFILIFLRPLGTLTSTRYLYSSMGLTYLNAA